MKRKHSLSTFRFLTRFALVLGASALAACSNPLALSESSSDDPNSGKLIINIPAMASWIQEIPETQDTEQESSEKSSSGKALAKTLTTTKSSSKALAYVSKYTVEVKNASGQSVIAPMTTTISADALDGSSSTTVSVPTGSDYTVSLKVYNEQVSSSEPVVEGSASGVSVTKDTNTTLSITCLPVDPIELSLDDAEVTKTLSYHGEQWYSATVESGTTYYVTETGAYSVIGIFNGAGKFISTNDSYITYTADYDGTLYIVDYAHNGAETAGVAISTTAPALNEGSAASPLALGLNVDHTFRIGSSDGSENISYYSFTVETAGDHALVLNGQYFVYLYSDSSFSTLISTEYASKGKRFSDLAAGTYYLKLQNQTKSSLAATGQIMDSAAIALVSNAEGRVSDPVELTLGTSHAATIGYQAYDQNSYYTFTTESLGGYDYTISTNNPSVSTSVTFYIYIYSDASFSTAVSNLSASPGVSVSFVLNAGQTYYMRLFNSSTYDCTFDLEAQAVTPSYTSLAANATWAAASIGAQGEADWYQVSVSEGKSYVLYWDDSYEGSRSYSCDIAVSAYKADRSTSYFTNVDSGYTSGKTMTIPSGEDTIYIRVSGWGTSNTGTYALKLVPPNGGLDITVE